MARGVRFTKPERALINLAVEQLLLTDVAKYGKRVQDIKAKLDASEAPQVRAHSAVLVRDAITAFRSVLERRLIAPPNGAVGLFAQMQNRLNALGLTYEQCITIATQANVEWPRGNIKAQSLVNQAEVLLQNATSGSQTPITSSSRESTFEMDEL